MHRIYTKRSSRAERGAGHTAPLALPPPAGRAFCGWTYSPSDR